MKVVRVDANSPGVYSVWLNELVHEELPEGIEEVVLGLEDGKTAAGILAGHVEGVTFIVDALYIDPPYRHQGGARMLGKTLREVVVSYVQEVEFSFTENDPEHANLCQALEHLGFDDRADTAFTIFSLNLGELRGSILDRKTEEFGDAVDPSDEFQIRAIERFIDANELPGPRKGMKSDEIEYELSRVYMEKGNVVSYLISEIWDDNSISLAAAYNDGDAAVLLRMLQTIVAKALVKYSDETEIYIHAITKSSAALIVNLLPTARRMSHRYIFEMRDWAYLALLESGR